jgi:hypothetical protein
VGEPYRFGKFIARFSRLSQNPNPRGVAKPLPRKLIASPPKGAGIGVKSFSGCAGRATAAAYPKLNNPVWLGEFHAHHPTLPAKAVKPVSA